MSAEDPAEGVGGPNARNNLNRLFREYIISSPLNLYLQFSMFFHEGQTNELAPFPTRVEKLLADVQFSMQPFHDYRQFGVFWLEHECISKFDEELLLQDISCGIVTYNLIFLFSLLYQFSKDDMLLGFSNSLSLVALMIVFAQYFGGELDPYGI